MHTATVLQSLLERPSSKAAPKGEGVADDCLPSDASAPSATSSGVFDILAGVIIGLVLCVLVIH